MAAALEIVGDVPEARLEAQQPAVGILIEAPARGVERGLRAEAAVAQVRQQLQVPLRLHVAAHHAERADQRRRRASSIPGMIVWNGRLPGRQRGSGGRVEREAGAAVLQRDAGAGRDDAASRSRM